MDLCDHLYLTLGARIDSFQEALLGLAPGKDREAHETRPRHAAYETEIKFLPTKWFGYDAVDLMILTSGNPALLDALVAEQNQPHLQALADWVRRGGRLLVSVDWQNQDKLRALLQSPVWKPALPEILSKESTELTHVFAVQRWGGDKPFPAPGRDPIRVARLDAGKNVEIILREEKGLPILVRIPYGLGSVSFLAFDLHRGPFRSWNGRVECWKALLAKLAPRVVLSTETQGAQNATLLDSAVDISTALQRELDHFDTASISFGWVAFLLLVYIALAGPMDYLILRKLLGRMHWTWITFPLLVLVVTTLAGYSAHAIKGDELKINKVDLIDLDLRSDLDAARRPRQARLYGTTWFSFLSPRIQSYDVGFELIEPLSPPLVSWLGRPEVSGMGGMGRQRSQGLFQKGYEYAPGGAGLVGVPIPVRSTKAFTASWESVLRELPFEVDLHYNPTDPEQLTGAIRSRLPPLLDAWVYYGSEWIPLGSPSQKGSLWKIAAGGNRNQKADAWVNTQPQHFEGSFDPTTTIKRLAFLQGSDDSGLERNHSFRRLDQSWRLSGERWQRPGVTREAILFAYVPPLDFGSGASRYVGFGATLRMPADLECTLNQHTFIRAYLPVTPASP